MVCVLCMCGWMSYCCCNIRRWGFIVTAALSRVCLLLIHWPAGYCQFWLCCHKSIHRQNMHRLLTHTGLSTSIIILVSIKWRIKLLNFGCSKMEVQSNPSIALANSVTLLWLPWKSVNRNSLLCSMSIYHHPRHSATNCGVQTVELYRGLRLLIL